MERMKLLKTIIKERGYTITALASEIGIVRETLHKKLKGETEFTASEIVSITSSLRLTKSQRDAIFLPKEVN